MDWKEKYAAIKAKTMASEPIFHVDELKEEAHHEPSREQETQQSGNECIFLAPDLLDPHPQDPFLELDETEHQRYIDSVRKYGILSPIIVRPKDNGRYEILAGRNRTKAAIACGMQRVPCNIVDADEEQAQAILTETNLVQRHNLKPSELGFAYKMQYESLKRQGLSIQDYIIGKEDDEERDSSMKPSDTQTATRGTIYKYIRITYLIQELLDSVDAYKIAVTSGAYLSYLEKEEQRAVYQYFIIDRKASLDIEKAKKLRSFSRNNVKPIEYCLIDQIIHNRKKKSASPSLSINYKRIERYIPYDIQKKKDIEKFIIQALEYWMTNHEEAELDALNEPTVPHIP